MLACAIAMILTGIYLMIRIICCTVRKYKNKKGMQNAYECPAAVGWLGVACSLIFFTMLIASFFLMEPDGGMLFCLFVFLLFTALGGLLTGIGFNYRFELDGNTLMYTNVFGKTHIYLCDQITSIREKTGGDFVCSIQGRKNILIDSSFRVLIYELRERMPEDAIFDTLTSRQKKASSGEWIVSKQGKLALGLAVTLMIMTVFALFFVIPEYGFSWYLLIPLLYSCGYLYYVLHYRLTLDPRRRILKVRRFFSEKTYSLTNCTYRTEETADIVTAAVLMKDGKRLCKIDTAKTVTNRELLLETLMEICTAETQKN